jgi:hypothetical protein
LKSNSTWMMELLIYRFSSKRMMKQSREITEVKDKRVLDWQEIALI